MIQTQLIKALQVTATDGVAAPMGLAPGVEGAEPQDGKVAFAEAMIRAQQADQGLPAGQPGDAALGAALPDAKSLATDGEAGPGQPDKAKGDENEPPDDFLQQLQASLRQDVSLVVPLSPPPLSQPIAPSFAQPAVTAPLVTDGNDLPPESRPISSLEAGKAPTVAVQPGLSPRLGADAPQPSTRPSETGETEVAGDAGGAGKSTQGAGKGASLPTPMVPMTGLPTAARSGDDPVTPNEGAEPTADPEAKPSSPETARAPLSGQERAALLAKVRSGQTESAASVQGAEPPATGKGDKLSTDSVASGDQGPRTAQHTASQGAAKAFAEGLIKVASGTAAEAGADGKARLASQAAVDTEGSQPGAMTETGAQRAAQPPAAKAEQDHPKAEQSAVKPEQNTTQAAGTTAATPPVTEPSPEPVLAAPQQILARHESQGPQASLTALSAGIQQMEAEPAVAVKAAVELKQVDGKSRLDELGKKLAIQVKEPEQGESTPSPQQAQAPASDSKPAAEPGVRREAQSLPHLKLATPQAPEQLHQKVNLMLADKLQQAEIQLDPLGLGKMKIQIQMGADSQANVNFVVQHGQTREMLEQAMPRLRDMLAGQGIQLGQTQVQQQSQQQSQQQGQPSQGQSNLGGQGQQGSGSFGGRGQGEGEPGARSLSLLVESPNDSGIDFYA